MHVLGATVPSKRLQTLSVFPMFPIEAAAHTLTGSPPVLQFRTASEAPSSTAAQPALSVSDSLTSSDVSTSPRSSMDLSSSDGGDGDAAGSSAAHGERS